MSSGGGHWIQLQRLIPAFEDCDVAWATVDRAYRANLARPDDRFYVLPDATRWNKLALVHLMLKIALVILRERPDVIITTGAAPGYFALVFGRLLRKRTCWLDSVANVDELSLSGRKASRWADLWLTQWKPVATETGPYYYGSVLSNLLDTTTTDSELQSRSTKNDAPAST